MAFIFWKSASSMSRGTSSRGMAVPRVRHGDEIADDLGPAIHHQILLDDAAGGSGR